MPVATCHCGSISVEIPYAPSMVSDCNCTICRRYGVLWAYYNESEVKVNAPEGAADGYIWGDRILRFVRCHNCGCVTHWERIEHVAGSKIGVNARNLDPSLLENVPVEILDGLSD
jgi:hypothetical protein